MSKSQRYNPYEGYSHFKIKKSVPIQKLRDDLRDREARTECSDAKKFVQPTNGN